MLDSDDIHEAVHIAGKVYDDGLHSAVQEAGKTLALLSRKEWNESNFDIRKNDYCREVYEAKKWAFVTD